VDTTDLHRLEDCRSELHNLLKEERLTGATLLIFANKQDLAGSLAAMQLQKVPILDESAALECQSHIFIWQNFSVSTGMKVH
jgi:GTPase SAR1 family protein